MSKIDPKIFDNRDAEFIENGHMRAVSLPSASVGGGQDAALELSNIMHFISKGAAAYSSDIGDLEEEPETAVFICGWENNLELDDCGIYGPHPSAYLNLNASPDDPLVKAYLSLLDYPCLDETAMAELKGSYIKGLLEDVVARAMSIDPDDEHFWNTEHDNTHLAEALMAATFSDKLNDHIANDASGAPCVINEEELYPEIIECLEDEGLIVKEAISASPQP